MHLHCGNDSCNETAYTQYTVRKVLADFAGQSSTVCDVKFSQTEGNGRKVVI